MEKEQVEQILNNATFKKMAQKKSRLGWIFTALMLLVYFSFIGFIGVSPETFAKPIVEGSATTIGINVGLFVILFAVAITGIYVYKANGEFDKLTRDALKETGLEKLIDGDAHV